MAMKRNAPKAVFLDVDGTLLSFASKKVPESAREAVAGARAAGAKIFIATGRHKSELGTDDFLREFPFDGHVTQNGAYCYAGGAVLLRAPLGGPSMRALVGLVERERVACVFCGEHGMFMNSHEPRALALLAKYALPVPPLADASRALEEDIFQVVPITSGMPGDLPFASVPGAKATRWTDGGYDIVSADVNKWRGILAVIGSFGIAPEDTAAIGDAENDAEMLACAGHSVAMGNAPDSLKSLAKHTTTHVDDDGIKNAFAHLFGR